jgi:hypothetical protein
MTAASAKPIFATAAILVGGVHHDIGDEIDTDKDDAAALVRMGRVDHDAAKAKKARSGRVAAEPTAEQPAA